MQCVIVVFPGYTHFYEVSDKCFLRQVKDFMAWDYYAVHHW